MELILQRFNGPSGLARLVIMAMSLAFTTKAPAASSYMSDSVSDVEITRLFRQAALRYQVPVRLLRAISILESQGNPWALNINGITVQPKTRHESSQLLQNTRDRSWLLNIRYPAQPQQIAFFSSRRQAEAALQDLRRNLMHWRLQPPSDAKIRKLNVRSVDIGLMQINHLFHGRHFTALDDLLDPETNINYAAKYLSQLLKQHKTLEKAVAHYHSGTPKHQRRYLKHFWPIYRKLGQ